MNFDTPSWNKAENHPYDEIESQSVLGEKSLRSAHVGITLYGCRHVSRQFLETDSLNHAESRDDICNQLYSVKIHRFSKMFLHDRENLVNFDQVLGISNFYGEKRLTFPLNC